MENTVMPRLGFFFFKQKTAYEIYQCDWSSDVCSSDLHRLQKETPYLPPAASPTPPLFRDEPLPLVGRAAERAACLAHIHALLRQEGGVILLEGEAGVGKTRLAREVGRDAEWRGAELLWGACQEQAGGAPYAPLAQADRKSTRLNSSHTDISRMPSSA